jgi:hypothetical protein
MRCLALRDGVEQCTWALEGEENLSCWLDMNPDYCGQFTTKAACQERILTDPLQPFVGCVWVRETIHSTASPSCEPASTTQSCVTGSRSECDREGLTCPGGDSWVHFQDIGAGTAALLVSDPCLLPVGPYQEAEPCSFGDPTLPLLCDCGCE